MPERVEGNRVFAPMRTTRNDVSRALRERTNVQQTENQPAPRNVQRNPQPPERPREPERVQNQPQRRFETPGQVVDLFA